MKRAGFTAAVAVVLGCAVGAAQSNSGSQGTTQGRSTRSRSSSAQQKSTQANQTITVIGCVEGPQASASTSGATASTTGRSSSSRSSAPTYTLTNARMSTGADSAIGTSGSRTSSVSDTGVEGSASTYTLQGADLDRHVGHQVEIEGTVTPAARRRSPRSSSASGSTAAANETLRARSIRLLSDTCSGTSDSNR